ncbi:MAG TPA: DUF642 domain-containing protein [Sedimentisphaerales bacterium]|jgi:hypothetical protein|nr:DUF642 domain-containing protein [Sedimentisphaerales bacterium]HNU28546.1 DUF642 domain-containing protein [Sedimentisphaerales bacterium]
MKRTVFVLAIAVLPAAFAHANLITNGSFEAPDQATGTWSVYGSIPGWTTTFGPGIEIQDHVTGLAYDGDQFVELDSHSNSGMQQSISVIAGESYDLSFAYSPRPSVDAASNGIRVWFDGALLDTIAYSGIGQSGTSWTVLNYTVTAASEIATLVFEAVGISNSYGGYIDDVCLELSANPAVPAPGAIVLGAMGTSLVGWLRRRRAL